VPVWKIYLPLIAQSPELSPRQTSRPQGAPAPRNRRH
jgi:hypothetical protein